jgi:outer membrane biosynthesis protein TonB
MLSLTVSIACSREGKTPIELALPESPEHVRNPQSTSADLAIQMCPAKFNDSLNGDGIASGADKRVTPPVIVHSVEAELSDEARKALRIPREKSGVAGFAGSSLIGLVVDERGIPQNLCICKSIGYGLDANAASAIQQYRFNPATKDGKPVAYRITIKVDYWLY